MIRRFVVALLAFAVLSANAGEIVLEDMPQNYGELIYHLRVKADKSQMHWGMVWDYVSVNDYRGIELSADLLSVSDDFSKQQYRVELYRVIDGVRQSESVSNVYDSGDARHGISVKLRRNAIGAVIEIGTTTASAVLPIAFDGVVGGRVGSYRESPMTIVRHTVDVEALECVQYAPFDSEQQLADYLSKSSDAMEGYWEYLDRDTDALLFNVGGDYRFATVKIDNRYALVYLSGARTNDQAWKPLRIKAWLKPTIFIGNYDLEWYDPFGVKFDIETSAQVTDNAIMSINFPLYKSKVRWRRMLVAAKTVSGDIISQH
jgi:hypothetical protein